MPRGGKRKGAGAPKTGNLNFWIRIRPETLKRLKARIPNYRRSEFICDLIDANL